MRHGRREHLREPGPVRSRRGLRHVSPRRDGRHPDCGRGGSGLPVHPDGRGDVPGGVPDLGGGRGSDAGPRRRRSPGTLPRRGDGLPRAELAERPPVTRGARRRPSAPAGPPRRPGCLRARPGSCRCRTRDPLVGAGPRARVPRDSPLRRPLPSARRRARRAHSPDRQRPLGGRSMTSRPETSGKLPLTDLADMKRRRERIVMVTAYDYPSGSLADAAGVDIVLVGDSAAMTVLGYESTVPASMDEMVMLTRAAVRGARRPLVVADMPFGSFQVSDEEAVRSAVRFVKEAGADAVKVEGAGLTVSRVLALVGAGIPVMGHIGLTPQSATMLGGFRAQGRTSSRALQLLEEARTLEQAGCFSLVLEAVPAPVAARITEELTIPTIGIGSGRDCDGQVLVYHDLLGLYQGREPRFVKRYAELATEIQDAIERYAADVRSGAFPGDEHTYSIPDEDLAAFLSGSKAESETEA